MEYVPNAPLHFRTRRAIFCTAPMIALSCAALCAAVMTPALFRGSDKNILDTLIFAAYEFQMIGFWFLAISLPPYLVFIMAFSLLRPRWRNLATSAISAAVIELSYAFILARLFSSPHQTIHVSSGWAIAAVILGLINGAVFWRFASPNHKTYLPSPTAATPQKP